MVPPDTPGIKSAIPINKPLMNKIMLANIPFDIYLNLIVNLVLDFELVLNNSSSYMINLINKIFK